MELFPFFMSMIVTFAIIVFTCFRIMRCTKKIVNEIDKSINEVFYMLFLFVPIVIFVVLMKYIPQSASLIALIWILIFAFFNRILILKIPGKTIDNDTRLTLAFFAMLFSALFYIIQGLVKSNEYLNMADTIIALIIGFYVSLETVLSNQTFRKKLASIANSIKLFELKETEQNRKEIVRIRLSKITIILLMFFGIVLICVCAFDRIDFLKNNESSILFGFLVGYFFALFSVYPILKKNTNYLKNCNDTRCEIFEQEKFIDYKKKIEGILRYSSEEKYDCVETFLFYKAFADSLEKEEKIEADSLMLVCNHIQKEYGYFEKSSVSLRTYRNDNIYVLKKGRRKYCGDIMTSPWPLFKEYLRAYSGISLEDGNVPKNDRERYMGAGVHNNLEMWLLYFLEQYHSLTYKEKRAMIPNEVRSFLANTYKLGAMWAIPVGCNTKKMKYFIGKSGKRANYDFGDLTLLSIYEWFVLHETDSYGAGEKLNQLFGNDEKAVGTCEEWLKGYKNWKEFVTLNNLESLVKCKGIGVIKKEYREPYMFFEGHSYENLLPKTKKAWETMFDTISKLIYSRR